MNPIRLQTIGVDEVGRGALAGPLVACAVYFPIVPTIPNTVVLHDSKSLTPAARERAAAFVRKHALTAVSRVSPNVIDTIGIQAANALAFRRAVQKLQSIIPKPSCEVLADGRRMCDFSLPSRFIIGGDASEEIIAAASIVAKVYRDAVMIRYTRMYPNYSFASHKGYGTRKHLQEIQDFGPSPIHRTSFAPISCYSCVNGKSSSRSLRNSLVCTFDSYDPPFGKGGHGSPGRTQNT